MQRLFDKVLLCPPGNNYPHCISTHPQARTINLHLARQQHEKYTSTLRASRVEVEILPPQDSLPDSVFIQDPVLIGRETVLIGKSPENARQKESEIFVQHFADQDIQRVSGRATLEGGDILVAKDVVFVGTTGRTNLEGYEQLKRCFPEIEVKQIKFAPEFFHLLSTCSYLGDDQILICEKYVDKSSFDEFQCLPVSVEDLVAVNVLPLGDSKILMPSGYHRVRGLLLEYGYQPIEIDNSEFVKGDGRITCLSSPFYQNLV